MSLYEHHKNETNQVTMIKSVDINDLNDNNKFKDVKVFPFSVCQERHKHIPTHKHDFYELIFVIKGRDFQSIDNEVFDIFNNQVFLLSPYNVHNIEAANIDEAVVITFKEELLYKTDEDYLLLQNLIFGFGLNQKLIVSDGLSYKLKKYIEILKTELLEESINKEIIYSFLKIILISIQNEFTKKTKPSNSNNKDLTLFYDFMSLLNTNFKDEHSVTFYAETLNITPNLLNKVVKKITTKNTLTVIHERLIQEAKRLLIHTNNKSKAIAYELGFNDEAYFSKLFKKNVGISPKLFKLNEQ